MVLYVVAIEFNLQKYLHHITIISYFLVILNFLGTKVSSKCLFFYSHLLLFGKTEIGLNILNADKFFKIQCFDYFETRRRNFWFPQSMTVILMVVPVYIIIGIHLKILKAIIIIEAKLQNDHNKICVINKFICTFSLLLFFSLFVLSKKRALYLQFSKYDSWHIIYSLCMFKNVKISLCLSFAYRW